MANDDETLWTLGELSDRVAVALTHDYAGPPNQRVSDVPTPRVIRYYTTLGLIDRPAMMQGRTALYGHRHLLQLVAIKRLQAEGLSIAQVQARLLQLPDAALAAIARMAPDTAAPVPAPASRPRTKRAFWKDPVATAPAPPPPSAPAGMTVTPLQSVQLADGVTLLVATAASLSAPDLAALATAAQPLLDVLARQGHILTSIEGSPR
jgi:DNA-binding transcriptional MerR regulator